MAAIENDKVRYVGTTGTLDSMAALPAGGTFLANSVTQEIAHVYRAKVDLAALTFTVDCASDGGAADAVGQKVLTLPEGGIAVLGYVVSGTLTGASGLTSTDLVVGLGSARATADAATLTGTECDLGAYTDPGNLSSTALDVSVVANGGVADSLEIVDGTTTPVPVYLNFAGTFVKSSGATSTMVFDGSVTILFTVIGDD